MPFGKVRQSDAQLVCAHQARRNVFVRGKGDVKLERSPGWNLVRAEHSRLCTYAFVERQLKNQEVNDRVKPIANIRNNSTCVPAISSVKGTDEYTRTQVKMELDLAPVKSRGYWKYHTPGKWFKQEKAIGKINIENATMLIDYGAEVSIIDTTFARKVGCMIDESRTQECVGIGENAYMTTGRTKIKIKLDNSLV